MGTTRRKSEQEFQQEAFVGNSKKIMRLKDPGKLLKAYWTVRNGKLVLAYR
jgi:hypothetical protein